MWKSRSSPGLKRLFEANTKTPEAGWSLLLRGQEEHGGRGGVEAVQSQRGCLRPTISIQRQPEAGWSLLIEAKKSGGH